MSEIIDGLLAEVLALACYDLDYSEPLEFARQLAATLERYGEGFLSRLECDGFAHRFSGVEGIEPSREAMRSFVEKTCGPASAEAN